MCSIFSLLCIFQDRLHNCTLPINYYDPPKGYEYIFVKGKRIPGVSIKKISIPNVREILSHTKDVDDIDIHRMAIYRLHEHDCADTLKSNKVLYFHHQLKTPEEIAEIIRQAPEF